MIIFVLICLFLGLFSLIAITGFTIGDSAIDSKILARNRIFMVIVWVVFLGLYLSIKGKISKSYAALIAGAAVGLCFIVFKQIVKQQEGKDSKIKQKEFDDKYGNTDKYSLHARFIGKVVEIEFLNDNPIFRLDVATGRNDATQALLKKKGDKMIGFLLKEGASNSVELSFGLQTNYKQSIIYSIPLSMIGAIIETNITLPE